MTSRSTSIFTSCLRLGHHVRHGVERWSVSPSLQIKTALLSNTAQKKCRTLARPNKILENDGEPCAARTRDLLIKSQLLYRLS